MNIYNLKQYNQGISKYKLLSSTAGVGSIVTTKFGFYVLITDINKWHFVNWANTKVDNSRKKYANYKDIYEESRKELSNQGLEIVDDQRFIKFLTKEKELATLICLIKIPHMTLNENNNYPKWTTKINETIVPYHPIAKALANEGEPFKDLEDKYMINGIHFPKWFKNKDGKLKKIDQWFLLWKTECKKNNSSNLTLNNFAPPRDAENFKERRNKEGKLYHEYNILQQTNLVLICENGHLSDIPWSNYLKWQTIKKVKDDKNADFEANLLSIEAEPCCTKPDLKWTENTAKSEGYGSIYIECKSCGLGTGESKEKPKVNLEGINSIQPYCQGHKPWEIDLDKQNDIVPFGKCEDVNDSSKRLKMKVRLVTANNIYFANCFSSLYVPLSLIEAKSKNLRKAIEITEERYQTKKKNSPDTTKRDFWDKKVASDFEEFASENSMDIDRNNSFFQEQLKNAFLGLTQDEEIEDTHDHYRLQEYQCFVKNSRIEKSDENDSLKFVDIELPNQLTHYFSKIQQVEELKVTNVQLDFTRVNPKQRIVRITKDGEKKITESAHGPNIFSIDSKDLYVLPANEILGEGIFFQFNDESIHQWISNYEPIMKDRFEKILTNKIDDDDQGASSKVKLQTNRYKHFLIHSFAHLMMRELEFSCGYPTASLKERLYISNSPKNPDKQMSGVLIYTAEGSEGSMGGLVSQGEPDKILEIIKKGLERTINCSSDPLCWESDGQGIFDLNLSACFSCSLVSETACEEMNLGLDRRVLVDEEFGFFRELIL